MNRNINPTGYKQILVYDLKTDRVSIRYSKSGLKNYNSFGRYSLSSNHLYSKAFTKTFIKSKPYLIDYYLGLTPNASRAAKLQVPSLSEIWDKVRGKPKEDVPQERRYDVFSSNLDQVAYSPSEKILQIIFKSGGIYHYYDVPEVVFNKLLAANSKGQFFHQFIKNSYKYDKIR